MKQLYNKIGIHYDQTRNAEPLIVKTLLCLLDIDINKNYLDRACWTGNYTIELVKSGGAWTGFDI